MTTTENACISRFKYHWKSDMIIKFIVVEKVGSKKKTKKTFRYLY